MELTIPPEHVGPMRRAYFPRMLCSPSTFSQYPRTCFLNARGVLRGTSEGCCRIRGVYSEEQFHEPRHHESPLAS